jgi:site-specific recombinase XerC
VVGLGVVSTPRLEEDACLPPCRWIRSAVAARPAPSLVIWPVVRRAARAGAIPRTEEIIAVMRCCGERPHGLRARGLIVVLWRARLRTQEALDLSELDRDPRRGSVLVRRGKGGHRREVGMDD